MSRSLLLLTEAKLAAEDVRRVKFGLELAQAAEVRSCAEGRGSLSAKRALDREWRREDTHQRRRLPGWRSRPLQNSSSRRHSRHQQQ